MPCWRRGSAGWATSGRSCPWSTAWWPRERELSDTGLLAALLLPKVLLRRYDIEALDQRPMTRSALDTMIQDEVTPFLARFTVSNLKAQQIVQALIGFQRLCEPMKSIQERVRYTRKPWFDDARLLFEILVEATGDGREALEEWEAAARRRPPLKAPEQAEARAGRPRRRRRRRPGPAM